VNAPRVVAWLWSGAPLARLARLPLTPLAVLYWTGMRLRTAAYRAGWRRVARLPLPSVAVGNLSVGGTGKTPLAAWIARYYAGRGHRPAIVLRGYGGDETLVHQRLVPEAVVVANPDRAAGTRAAAAGGAAIVVLDDAYQLLGVARDLNIAVLSADAVGASVWPLPAGPWREGADALERAALIVVTRKQAALETATALADWIAHRRPGAPVCIAHLALGHLEALRSGARVATTALAGRRVVAAAGIADPASFAAQLRAAGATVQLQAYQDHHAYRAADLAWLARAAAAGDYVVVTEKDAVKLRGRWPEHVAEPLVAVLDVRWERNGRALEQALDAVLAPAARA
jgi:tetraacyldisaccharide 4'-kinase